MYKNQVHTSQKTHCFYTNKTKQSMMYKEIIYYYAENYNKGGVHTCFFLGGGEVYFLILRILILAKIMGSQTA